MQDDCVELQVITKLPWPLRLIRVGVSLWPCVANFTVLAY